MTAPVVTTVAAGSARRGPTVGDGTTARSRGRARWLRWRPFVLAVSIVLAAAAVAALPAPRTSNEPLEPDSVGPRGSRAVAQILGDQGVRVVPSVAPPTRCARPGAGALRRSSSRPTTPSPTSSSPGSSRLRPTSCSSTRPR